jgi:2-iminobutanoate/2-iminopropanoate deaminase
VREVYEAFEGQQEKFGYAQAQRVGETVYVAGTLGIDKDRRLPDSFEDEMTTAYRNIEETLRHFDARLTNVVEQTIYVTDIDDGIATRPLRKAMFGGKDLPASTMIEISKLAIPGARVEITVTARLDI